MSNARVHQVWKCLQWKSGAQQMELPSPLISWGNPLPSRVINRTIFFYNALESHECTYCLVPFLYFHWLLPLLARETSSGNRSIYTSTLERVDSKGLYGRQRLHLMGSCENSTQKLLPKYSTEEKNRQVICRPRSVRIGKNCTCGFGPHSKPLAQFFPIRTSRPANNIYVFAI